MDDLGYEATWLGTEPWFAVILRQRGRRLKWDEPAGPGLSRWIL